MTVAENKAKELIEKFWVYSAANDKGSWQNAKACAIICVEQAMLSLNPNYFYSPHVYSDYIEFWKEVIDHINKM